MPIADAVPMSREPAATREKAGARPAAGHRDLSLMSARYSRMAVEKAPKQFEKMI